MIQPTPMWTDIVNAIANAFIAITAVAAAWFGLRQWRRETVGRTKGSFAVYTSRKFDNTLRTQQDTLAP